MNWWQIMWRSHDEARLTVRFMLSVKLAALILYVNLCTTNLFDVIDAAMAQNGDAAWANLTAILGAITAFCGITIPVLAKMYLQAWSDYRKSNGPLHTDFKNGDESCSE